MSLIYNLELASSINFNNSSIIGNFFSTGGCSHELKFNSAYSGRKLVFKVNIVSIGSCRAIQGSYIFVRTPKIRDPKDLELIMSYN